MIKMRDEVFSDWFVFGEHSTGEVDIADCGGDLVQGVSSATAEAIINLRDKFLSDVLKILEKES